MAQAKSKPVAQHGRALPTALKARARAAFAALAMAGGVCAGLAGAAICVTAPGAASASEVRGGHGQGLTITPRELERIVLRMHKEPERYSRRYIELSFSVAPDGVVTEEAVLTHLALRRAAARAAYAEDFICYDTDADGTLSAAEVDMAVALSRSTRRKTTLRTAFVEGDSNGDGRLDLPEIYARYDADGRRRGGGEELAMLLMMDGDGDGRVTTEEIMNYVAIFGAKSDQEMREWLTTLLKHWPED